VIVALESIDAGGKRTQADAVTRFFRRETFSSRIKTVKQFDFPHYETTAGAVVGRVLRGETIVYPREQLEGGRTVAEMAKGWGRDKAVIIQSLMVSDRMEHMEMLIEFAMSTDNLLILDRYKWSGVVYGTIDGLESKWIKNIQSSLPDADMNILIDISVEESVRRRPVRRDNYERNLDMLNKVRAQYRTEFEAAASDDSANSHLIVNGERDPEEVTNEIVAAIWKRIGDAFSDD